MTKTATYTPNLPYTGPYDIYVWYPSGGNRSAQAPHVVSYNGGSETFYVNQQSSSGGWRRARVGQGRQRK